MSSICNINLTGEHLEQWKKQAAVQRECELELNALMMEQEKLRDDYEEAKAFIDARRQVVVNKMKSVQGAMVNIYKQSQKPT